MLPQAKSPLPQPIFKSSRPAPTERQKEPQEPQKGVSLQNTSNPPETGAERVPDDFSDGSHLNAFKMPEIDAEDSADEGGPIPVDEAGEVLAPLAEPELLDKAAFWAVFETAFSIPGMIVADFGAVAIQPEERETARRACDAVYELLRAYYPSALTPQSETFAHIVTAGPFFIAKAMIVKEIMRSRRVAANARDVTPQRDHGPNVGAPPAPPQEQPQSAPQAGNWHLPGQEVTG